MIYLIGGGMFVFFSIIGIVHYRGYSKGRNAVNIENLQAGVDDVLETNKRRANRRNDDISTVRGRLRKNARD